MDIQTLNSKYALAGQLTFTEGKGFFPMAVIENQFAKCEVSLYGAQVLSYQPKGQQDLLWMSDASMFQAGKAIRGGIPICFPWFGPHETDTQKPMHGFARLLTWNVTETSTLVNGATQLKLNLNNKPVTLEMWPFPFEAEVVVVVGDTLEVTLSYSNSGNKTFVCSDALHTYFNVSDIANVSIAGLTGTKYFVGPDKDKVYTQTEQLLTIQKEENRRYIDHTGHCIIEDTGYNRKIRVVKKGSKVTVVWNPWDGAKNMADMLPDGYKTMICVEAVNAYNNMVSVNPGQSFSVSTIIGVV